MRNTLPRSQGCPWLSQGTRSLSIILLKWNLPTWENIPSSAPLKSPPRSHILQAYLLPLLTVKVPPWASSPTFSRSPLTPFQGYPLTRVPTPLHPSVCSFLCTANALKMLRIHLLASQQSKFKSSVHNSPGDTLLRGEMCPLWYLSNACHPGKRHEQEGGRYQVRTSDKREKNIFLFPNHEDTTNEPVTKISSYFFCVCKSQ